jgi:site-specific DNA recombinase
MSEHRAGVYERVSRAKDKRASKIARSIEEQNAANRQACADENWAITRTFQDPNRSASRFATRDRPAYRELLGAVGDDELDVVVLWESSRGGRELEAWAGFLNACRQHKVKVHVTSHGRTYDMSVGRDWKALAEDGVDSANESEKTSERTLRATAANARDGRPHGLAPYGYQRTYDPVTRELVAQERDPATAPVVANIISRVAGGDPIEAVTRDLNNREIPSPRGGQWTHATVRWICMNPTYVGKRKHNGGPLLDGTWPALADEVTFWAGVSLLTAPSRKVTRPGRARWLLSLVAECAKCGGPAVARAKQTTGVMFYTCRPNGCFYAPLAEIDAQISALVIARLSRRDAYAELAAADDKAVLAARAEAGRLRGVLAGYKADAIAEKITKDDYAEIAAGLKARIAKQDAAAVTAGVPLALRDLLTPGADIKARWEALGIPARKDVLRTLFSSITIAPSATRTHRGQPAAPFDPDRVDVTWRAS